MNHSTIFIFILCCSLVWGCTVDDIRVGSALGSGEEPKLLLFTEDLENKELTNSYIEIISSLDLTGCIENGSEGIIQSRKERVVFQWHEEARSDYFAIIQNAETGDTIRVMFEGATKKGIAEISFNISALEIGAYRWLLTRKDVKDTVQQVEFIVH